MRRVVIGLIILAAVAAIVYVLLTTNATEALAPVLASGSAIIVVAYLAGLYTYRHLRNRKDA